MIRVGTLLLLCTGASAQLPGFEGCPYVTTKQNFEVTRFLGTWFQIWTYLSLSGSSEKCLSANFKKNTEYSMNVTASLINTETNKLVEYKSTATLLGKTNEGKFLSNYPNIRPSLVWILDTDYVTFAVAFSCRDITEKNAINVIIFGRDRKLPEDVFQKVLTILDEYQLSRDQLKKSNQEDCPFIDNSNSICRVC